MKIKSNRSVVWVEAISSKMCITIFIQFLLWQIFSLRVTSVNFQTLYLMKKIFCLQIECFQFNWGVNDTVFLLNIVSLYAHCSFVFSSCLPPSFDKVTLYNVLNCKDIRKILIISFSLEPLLFRSFHWKLLIKKEEK